MSILKEKNKPLSQHDLKIIENQYPSAIGILVSCSGSLNLL